MKNRLAPIALSMGLLGLVGGVAAAAAFGGGDAPEPKSKVELVQPAAETVTPAPTTTAVQTPAPAVKKKAPAVSSKKRSSTAPSTVQRQAIVSEPAPEPTTPTRTAPAVKWGPAGPPPNPEAPAAK